MDDELLMPIKPLLVAREFGDAKKAIEQALIKHPNHPLLISYLASLHMQFGDFDRSRSELEEAVKCASRARHIEAQAFAELWLGYLNNRQNRPESAVQHFEASADLQPPSSDLCAVLCQTCAKLGDVKKAKMWGSKALEMRASEVSCPAKEKVAQRRPHRFEGSRRERNVMAFSLFGNDVFYRECAVTIARSARGLFPEFSCWFYCSEDIPTNVKRALHQTGAKVMIMKPGTKSVPQEFSGLLWRFLPFDEPDVDIVIPRDVDSPFTLRERLAIEYWLGTDAPFVTMRDHVQHTEPLMAGMWGGFTKLLPPLGPVMARYRPQGNPRYGDQEFLRRFVWPRIGEATLAIDSVYTLGRTVNFPPGSNLPGSLNVGTGWRRNQILGSEKLQD